MNEVARTGVAVLPRRRDRAPWASGGPRGGRGGQTRPGGQPGIALKTTCYLKNFPRFELEEIVG